MVEDIALSNRRALEPLLESDGSEHSSGEAGLAGGAKSSLRRGPRHASTAKPDQRRGSSKRKKIVLVALGFLCLLGVVQLLTLLSHVIMVLTPNGIQVILRQWDKIGYWGSSLSSYPTDFTRDIRPVPCHSHNDYWRRVPLFSAVEAGCTGVEADIWFYEDTLYVGHSVSSLTANRTLQSLYIQPLIEILEHQNPKESLPLNQTAGLHGVFDTDPEQTLVLLIDFKMSGSILWAPFYKSLDPLRSRGYLTKSEGVNVTQGPITVVCTGEAPFSQLISEETNPHHDVFFDAPLGSLEESGQRGKETQYASWNSYYASTSFAKAIGRLSGGEFSAQQLQKVRQQIGEARKRRLKARYWDTPGWPVGLRNRIWETLVHEGADMLNVDDLKAATTGDWSG